MEQKLVDAELSYARCPGKKWMRGTLYLGLKVSWFEMLEGGGLEKKFPPDSEDRARARRNDIHSLTEHVFWGRNWRYRDEEDRDAPRAPLKAGKTDTWMSDYTTWWYTGTLSRGAQSGGVQSSDPSEYVRGTKAWRRIQDRGKDLCERLGVTQRSRCKMSRIWEDGVDGACTEWRATHHGVASPRDPKGLRRTTDFYLKGYGWAPQDF